MKCSYCGEEIEDGLEVCPFCNGEVSSEVQEPTTKEDAKDPQETAPKELPADKSKTQEKARVTPVKSQGKGALVGAGILGAIALVGFVVMSVLFIKTNLELAEAKDSIGRLEYQLAAAQSASSSGNGQVDTSALPPAPASYKGTTEGISWEAYKYKDKSCVIVVEPQNDPIGLADFNIKFKDATGGLLAAKSEHASGVLQGKKGIINIYDGGDFYDMEVNVTKNDASFLKPYEISETHTINGKKVIVEASNKGDAEASTVSIDAIFYKEGKVVDHESSTILNFAPGASEAKELSTYDEFDRVEVFVTATRH